MSVLKAKGFTLIELLIVIAIVGIISMIAIPAYSNYIVRGKIVDAHSGLTLTRMSLEQYYLDNHTYLVYTCPANTDYFSYACTLAASTFTITASSLANKGMGNAGDYVFTINQQNAKATTKYAGKVDTSTFWRKK